VEICIALGEGENDLTQELLLGMGDEARMAIVRQGLAQILGEPESRLSIWESSKSSPSLETSLP
jgi:hypothetical protein